MKKEKFLKRAFVQFIILTNIIFLLFLAVIGLFIAFEASERIISILKIISAWSSTFALLILFRKIYPNVRVWDFIKKLFSTKIKFSVIGIIIIIQLIIFAITVFITSDSQTITVVISTALIYGFFTNLVSGPLGEELGWRGYALNELQIKHSPLKSSIIIGVLWGFWHTPLWILTGFTGLDLLLYCGSFMVAIISVSIMITFFYNRNKNLWIPIIIHLLFNYLVSIIKYDIIYLLIYMAVGYFVVAVSIIVINPKQMLHLQSNDQEIIT